MKRFESMQKKVLAGVDLERWLTIARFKRKKIVCTSGSFDLLHQGHIRFLAEASERGDELVVALETDAAVRKHKGDKRPVLDQDARALILAALHFVSVIVLVDTEGLPDLIRLIHPDYLVLSADSANPSLEPVMKDLGGEVLTLESDAGFSTTDMADSLTS